MSHGDNYMVRMLTSYLQEDLSEDDVMILDNGTTLFVWFGKNASEMEKKLSMKSAQVLSRLCLPNNFNLLLF